MLNRTTETQAAIVKLQNGESIVIDVMVVEDGFEKIVCYKQGGLTRLRIEHEAADLAAL